MDRGSATRVLSKSSDQVVCLLPLDLTIIFIEPLNHLVESSRLIYKISQDGNWVSIFLMTRRSILDLLKSVSIARNFEVFKRLIGKLKRWIWWLEKGICINKLFNKFQRLNLYRFFCREKKDACAKMTISSSILNFTNGSNHIQTFYLTRTTILNFTN